MAILWITLLGVGGNRRIQVQTVEDWPADSSRHQQGFSRHRSRDIYTRPKKYLPGMCQNTTEIRLSGAKAATFLLVFQPLPHTPLYARLFVSREFESCVRVTSGDASSPLLFFRARLQRPLPLVETTKRFLVLLLVIIAVPWNHDCRSSRNQGGHHPIPPPPLP